MLRAYLSAVGAMPVVIAVAVIAMFLPVLTVRYAFSDDYPLLWMAVSGRPNGVFGASVFNGYAAGGRPLGGLLYSWFFAAAGSIDGVVFIRLFAVASIVALALLLHWALVRARIGRTVAALISVLLCSMPAFQLYAAWATLACAPLAALLAGGASMLAMAPADASMRRVAARLAGATGLLLGALLIYQPAAMLFWVFLAIALVGARDEPRAAWRTTRLSAQRLRRLSGRVSTISTRSPILASPLSSCTMNFDVRRSVFP